MEPMKAAADGHSETERNSLHSVRSERFPEAWLGRVKSANRRPPVLSDGVMPQASDGVFPVLVLLLLSFAGAGTSPSLIVFTATTARAPIAIPAAK